MTPEQLEAHRVRFEQQFYAVYGFEPCRSGPAYGEGAACDAWQLYQRVLADADRAQRAAPGVQGGEPTAFAYLLNCLELASQAANPASLDYGTHRSALFEYVRNLEIQHPMLKGGPMKFRKKPFVIDAIRWTGNNLREVITFTDGPPETRTTHAGMAWDYYVELVRRDGLKLFTLEGKMSAAVGDWIIKGVAGEHYPCKPEIFAATYEPAAQPPQQSAQPVVVITVQRNALVSASRLVGFDALPDGDHSLYAAAQPVEVQRVPLTKAEIERIYHRYGGDMMNCTRAIERAFDAKVARTVGLTPEQLEEIAKAIYAASKSYLWMANSCYEELTPDDQEICREMGRAAHGIFPANSESPTLPAAAVAEGAQLDGASLEQAS